MVAAVVAGAAECGALSRRVEAVRSLLAERLAALTKEVTPWLSGTGTKLWPCSGGYFLWLDLPSAINACAIASILQQGKPPVRVGLVANASGLRLCFAGLPGDSLKVAAKLIGTAVR